MKIMEVINLNASFAYGTLVREHFLAFDFIDEKNLLGDVIRLTSIGNITEPQTPPTAINVEFFLTSLAMIIPYLYLQANKHMNGNMDPLQMIGKSSFLLSKKQ